MSLRRAGAAAWIVIALLGCSTERQETEQVLPVVPATKIDTSLVAENRLTGSNDYYSRNYAAQSDLAVWASPYAPRAGDTLDLYIHANGGPVTVVVYRIGWYNGAGARKIQTINAVPAQTQPACTTSEPVVCPWSRTMRIPVGADWLSGLYLIKVIGKTTQVAYYPFVVSDPSPATFTAVVPQFTWQAYNDYNGRSLYSYNDNVRGHVVSFERPYRGNAGASFVFANVGSQELSTIHWLERNSYDVHYVSDLDVARGDFHPNKGLLFVGHDEYWTWGEFSNVLRARNGGTHLAFFAANNAYRAVRLWPGSVIKRDAQLISCFNTDTDLEAMTPQDVTRPFRDAPLNRPENQLYGIMYTRIASSTGSPLAVAEGSGGREGAQFLKSAGISPGDTISLSVTPVPTPETSFEGDMIVDNGFTPSNLQVLLRLSLPYYPRDTAGTTTFHTTFFTAPSGAGVFASGINEWGRWLDSFAGPENKRIQDLTGAVLNWMRVH